jgi:hypothetical protein
LSVTAFQTACPYGGGEEEEEVEGAFGKSLIRGGGEIERKGRVREEEGVTELELLGSSAIERVAGSSLLGC